ncbi:MAG TPA: hypothetical protein VFV49_06330 [Thermoanaerobaculia bacterium]|nr:hypothetical protein [Thermoanaerobaculia bacterium]
MGRAKQAERTRSEELWDEYQAIQLTPEQKAAARRRAEERAEQASRDGTYERVREIAGTVKWSMSWQELRDKE